MDKKNTGLNVHDRRRIAHEARHIQGSLSTLLALEKLIYRFPEFVRSLRIFTERRIIF